MFKLNSKEKDKIYKSKKEYNHYFNKKSKNIATLFSPLVILLGTTAFITNHWIPYTILAISVFSFFICIIKAESRKDSFNALKKTFLKTPLEDFLDLTFNPVFAKKMIEKLVHFENEKITFELENYGHLNVYNSKNTVLHMALIREEENESWFHTSIDIKNLDYKQVQCDILPSHLHKNEYKNLINAAIRTLILTSEGQDLNSKIPYMEEDKGPIKQKNVKKESSPNENETTEAFILKNKIDDISKNENISQNVQESLNQMNNTLKDILIIADHLGNQTKLDSLNEHIFPEVTKLLSSYEALAPLKKRQTINEALINLEKSIQDYSEIMEDYLERAVLPKIENLNKTSKMKIETARQIDLV